MSRLSVALPFNRVIHLRFPRPSRDGWNFRRRDRSRHFPPSATVGRRWKPVIGGFGRVIILHFLDRVVRSCRFNAEVYWVHIILQTVSYSAYALPRITVSGARGKCKGAGLVHGDAGVMRLTFENI
jgi:hypothetical protein